MKHYKVVFLGESSVGKTSIIIRFIRDYFNEYVESTVGSAFFRHISPEYSIKMDIWDTAGQERYKSLVPFYYRNANFAVIVYDVQDRYTIEVAKKWIDKLSKEEVNCKIYLVGNKIDGIIKITQEEQDDFCKMTGIKSFRTSAKTRQGINELFETIMKEEYIPPKQEEIKNEKIEINEENKKCCY